MNSMRVRLTSSLAGKYVECDGHEKGLSGNFIGQKTGPATLRSLTRTISDNRCRRSAFTICIRRASRRRIVERLYPKKIVAAESARAVQYARKGLLIAQARIQRPNEFLAPQWFHDREAI